MVIICKNWNKMFMSGQRGSDRVHTCRENFIHNGFTCCFLLTCYCVWKVWYVPFQLWLQQTSSSEICFGVFFCAASTSHKKKKKKISRQLFSVFCFLLLFPRTKCSPLIRNRWLLSLTPVIHGPSCCCRWFWNLCNPGGHPVQAAQIQL